jgi:hypothetical protein
MPRVNRDLQRRLAARRERERRRPSPDRRYRFAPADGTAVPSVEDGELEDVASERTTLERTTPERTTPERASPSRRGSAMAARAQSGRPAPRPYSDYAADYAYVFSDLRRVTVVVGSLLLALIVLSFILPR